MKKDQEAAWEEWVKKWSFFSLEQFLRSPFENVKAALDRHGPESNFSTNYDEDLAPLDKLLPWPLEAVVAYSTFTYILPYQLSLIEYLRDSHLGQWWQEPMYTLKDGLRTLPEAFANWKYDQKKGDLSRNIVFGVKAHTIKYTGSSVEVFCQNTTTHDKPEPFEEDEPESSEGDEPESFEGDEDESFEGDEHESLEGDEHESSEGDEHESSEGDEQPYIKGDRVIIALPINIIRGIKFSPPLPPKHYQVFENLNTISGAKIMIQCRRRFWQKHGIPGGCSTTNMPIGRMFYPTNPGLKVSKNERGILVCYAWKSEALIFGSHRSDEDAIAEAVKQIAEIHPEIKKEFEVGAIQSWYNDPAAQGCSTFLQPEETTLMREIMESPHEPIYIAGEGISFSNGWIQGALESGLRAAYQLYVHNESIAESEN